MPLHLARIRATLRVSSTAGGSTRKESSASRQDSATIAITVPTTVVAFEASDVAVEVSTAGLRKPAGEMYPAPAFLEMCLDAGRPVALSSDAHQPDHLGYEYERAVEWLGDMGVTELAGFEKQAASDARGKWPSAWKALSRKKLRFWA